MPIPAFSCSAELQATIQFDSDFTATTMLHPSTYLNKVLVGSSQGNMQLWNIKTQYAPQLHSVVVIHNFSPLASQGQNSHFPICVPHNEIIKTGQPASNRHHCARPVPRDRRCRHRFRVWRDLCL